MEQNFKKVEAKFKFSKKWIDITDKEQEVTVDLMINYHNKTFSVTPENQPSGKFIFGVGGANSVLLWNAVLESIKDATYFANKELGFKQLFSLTNKINIMGETIKSTHSFEVLKIAMICHQANKALLIANGDYPLKHWHELEDWQRQNTIADVNFRLENPNSGHDAQHNAWLEEKKKEGWVYGDVKDEEAKTHPLIVPFEELPEFQKKKYILFCSIVDALKD